MTEKTLYERHESPSGRVRYEPCAKWVEYASLPFGTYVLTIKPSSRSLVSAPADLAEVVAALESIRERLTEVAQSKLQEQPVAHDPPAERRACAAALRAYRRAGGLRYGPQWQSASATDIVDALFRAVAEAAK